MKENKALIYTFLTKSVALITNFFVVLMSIKIWGTEGRGFISYIVADTAALCIVANLFVGSTFSYHNALYDLKKIAPISLSWIILVSVFGGLIFQWAQGVSAWLITILTLITSLVALVNNYQISQLKFNLANKLSILFNLLFLFLIACVFWFDFAVDWLVYFILYTSAYFIVFLPELLKIFKDIRLRDYRLDGNLIKELFNYGFMNELSYFLQFLNYRVSYFFIAQHLGVKSLGIFGVAVVFSESIWLISNSISTVQYAQIIQHKNDEKSRKMTLNYSFYSLIFSIIAVGFLLIFPDQLFTSLFNKDFNDIHSIFIALAPGILAIGFSTIFGHYFAGIARQRILVMKSMMGLITAIITLPYLGKWYGLGGVAASMSISYLISSLILIIAFFFPIPNKKQLR